MLTGRGWESDFGPALVKWWYQLILLFIVYWYLLFHRPSVVTLWKNLFSSKVKNNLPSLRFEEELCWMRGIFTLMSILYCFIFYISTVPCTIPFFSLEYGNLLAHSKVCIPLKVAVFFPVFFFMEGGGGRGWKKIPAQCYSFACPTPRPNFVWAPLWIQGWCIPEYNNYICHNT